MKFTFTNQFQQDFKKLKSENPKLVSKILEFVFSIENNKKHPLEGIGKPEKLKGNLAGCYSRRIDDKHRLIYEYSDDLVTLISCYGHYSEK